MYDNVTREVSTFKNEIPFHLEEGIYKSGVQLVRCVIDTIQNCNLRCKYCHPGSVWIEEHLDIECIKNLFRSAEDYGIPEVVLTGGEITLHPQLDELLESTNIFNNTSVTLITNATTVTEKLLEQLQSANITRFCISLDGPSAEIHNSARGKTFDQVMSGLRQIRELGVEITVISVAHQGNFRFLTELSRMLVEENLASQHHLCAPSYSGTARQYYDKLKLNFEDFYELRNMVNEVYADLHQQGLLITFNSFWPVTGERSKFDEYRSLTLQQLTEQTKDIYTIVRSNGDFRLTHAAWGRETVGNAVIGNLYSDEAKKLFEKAHRIYENGEVLQLPREVEALHKFQVGDRELIALNMVDNTKTEKLITQNNIESEVELVPITSLDKSSILDNPIDPNELSAIMSKAKEDIKDFRFIRHTSGVYIIFEKRRSRVTILKPSEWNQFLTEVCE